MKIDLTCPVELWHYALPTEQFPVCRLQLFNLTEQTVVSVQAIFSCYDREGLLISRQAERVQRLDGKGRSAFEMAVQIENGIQAAGMDFSVEKVWFEDGTIWRHSSENMSEYTPNALPDGMRREVLRYLAGQDALGFPMDQGAVWLCVCGRPNAAGEDTCRRCGRLKRDVFTSFNEATVEKVIFEYENAKEEKERQERLRAQQEAEAREAALLRKRRKRKRITLSIVGTLLALILAFGIYFHAIPYYRFYAASRQLENGVYAAARSEFLELADQRGKHSLPIKIDAIGLDIDLLDMRLYYKSADLAQECSYRQAAELLGTGTVPALRTAQDTFDALADYKDSRALANEARYRRAQLMLTSRQYADVITLCDEMDGYKDSAALRNTANYQWAGQLMDAGSYEEARQKFLALGNYEDSARRAQLCLYQPAIEALDAGSYRQAIDLLTQLDAGFESTAVRLQEAYYGLANSLFAAKDYENAAEYYLLAGDYRDAFSQATACLYEPACLLMDQGEYQQAKESFDKILSFRDAQEKSWQCSEALGRAAMEAGEYEQARAYLAEALDYEPAAALMQECYYLPAVALQEADDLVGALALLEHIPDYSDAAERLNQVRYALAAAQFDDGQFAQAADAFAGLADYEDSAERLAQARLEYARQLMEAGNYEDAIEQLAEAEAAEGADALLLQAHYDWGKVLLSEGQPLRAGEEFKLAGDYEDAAHQYEVCMYALAETAIAEDRYEDAALYLEDITEYADAAALRQQCIYHTAQVTESQGDMAEAAALYLSIRDYQDAAQRAEACYDAYYSDAYTQARDAIYAQDYPAAIAVMQTVTLENQSEKYGDFQQLYNEANYLYANQLYDEKQPYEALKYYRAIPGYKDVERKLDRICYRMLGRWLSRTGIEMEFRDDGTCTIDGKAYYFRGSQFAFYTGAQPDALRDEWTIYDCTNETLSVENNKSKVQYRMTRITE